MAIDDKMLQELLLKENYITAEDISRAEASTKKNHGTILDFLLAQGLVTKGLIGQATAEHYGVQYADLKAIVPPPEQVLKIPETVAKQYRVVLFNDNPKQVVVTTDNPEQEKLKAELQKIFKVPAILAYSLPEDIDALLVSYRKKLETRFNDIIKASHRVAPEIIDAIIEDALAYKTSDIHLEPQDKEVIVRFRIDGVLHEAGRIPKEYYENVLNRVKVQAQLRIDDHFSAQDGAIRYQDAMERVTDFRVSITPTLEGEKVVMRVLSHYVQGFSLGDIGFSPADQELFFTASHKPFGMILVVGPTGSGKTTTLYSLLKTLNRPEVNITTIEDPVEYRIPGINQIQVNTQTNLTFAQGLRSIVRQDPDIILVGEIRDSETAEIAVNAALTGHLLLSTFHANDAATAVPRLLDMEIEPFLLASTLEIIIAQRLVRKICEHCRHGVTKTKSELLKIFPQADHYFPQESTTLYEGKGCQMCGESGFRGRTAIFEFIKITPEMQDLILRHPSTKEIWELARSQGSHNLFEDGLNRVMNGVTTVTELLRIAAPPVYLGHKIIPSSISTSVSVPAEVPTKQKRLVVSRSKKRS